MRLRITSSRIRLLLTLLLWIISGVWFVSEITTWSQSGQFPYDPLLAFLAGFIPLIELSDHGDSGAGPIYNFNSTRHRQNRQNIIANVRAAYIDGVLRQALHETIPIALGLVSYPRALSRPILLWEGMPVERDVGSSDEIVRIFDDCGQALLILGAPGSGKTFTLLELCNGLLERAEKNNNTPIPVVLNLSTWGKGEKSLDEWITDEMLRQYSLAKSITRAWLTQAVLCLLLDGLDEVREGIRDQCVQSINDFLSNYTLPLVVCSRVGDYEVLSRRLNLSQALLIRQLEEVQVAHYLTDTRVHLSTVYDAIQQDYVLRDLSRTPLMLNVMASAYKDLSLEELRPLAGDKEWRLAHLYNAYTRRAFQRRSLFGNNYSARQALLWLRYIAQRMNQRFDTQFFLEDLQFSWLSASESLRAMTIVCLLFGGLFGVLRGVQSVIQGDVFWSVIRVVVGSVIGGAFIGLIIYEALTSYFSGNELSRIEVVDKLTIKRLSKRSTIRALGGGIVYGLISSFYARTVLGDLPRSIWIGLIMAVSTGLGSLIEDLIEPVESRQRLWPGQGIRWSVKTAFRGTVMVGLPYSILSTIVITMFVFLLTEGFLKVRFGELFEILPGGSQFLVPLSAICVFLVGIINSFFKYGGSSFVRHCTIRVLLSQHNHLPFSIMTFMDAMKDRILVQRVGASYQFIHLTFQEYIAALTEEEIEKLVVSADD